MVEKLIKYDDSATRKISKRVGNLTQYAEKLIQYAENYVVQDKKKEVGFLSFYANERTRTYAYLTLIAVDIRVRGQGIGKLMMQYMEEECKKIEFENIRLEVDKENKNAVGFYKSLGFKVKSNASEISYYMEKRLRKDEMEEKRNCF